ncbi:MAG: nucleoside triphosphate pyrophosphatase [Verrucomicrobiota bacterium]
MASRFILASGSPRRRELLAEAGYEFEIVSPPIEEVSHGWLTIRELTIHNATRKALQVARASPDAVVLAADTLVTIDGDVLGKPADISEAVAMLRRLSGRAHEVWTAVCICHAALSKSQTFHEISHVEFRALTDHAIKSYFVKINPLDKAGAYAAQGHGQEIIKRIEGSYSNVVGLPMETTVRVLRAFGITSRR